MTNAYTVQMTGWNAYFPGVRNYCVRLADGTPIAELDGRPGGGFEIKVMAVNPNQTHQMDRYRTSNVHVPANTVLKTPEEAAQWAYEVYNERVAYCKGERRGCR